MNQPGFLTRTQKSVCLRVDISKDLKELCISEGEGDSFINQCNKLISPTTYSCVKYHTTGLRIDRLLLAKNDPAPEVDKTVGLA